MPTALKYMPPSPTGQNLINGGDAYTERLCYRPGVIASGFTSPNKANLCRGQLRAVVGDAKTLRRRYTCTVSNPVSRVFFSRAPLEIIQSVISWLAVKMAALVTLWAGTNECFKHKLMQCGGAFLLAPAQIEVDVANSRAAAAKYSRGHKLRPALTNAFPTSLRSDTPKVGNLVKVFKPTHIQPAFSVCHAIHYMGDV